MNKMTVTRRLSLSANGPINAETEELVHLRQGDLDGACGPYCLISALIATGQLSRDEALNMHAWKKESAEGKFRDAIAKFGTLACNGTTRSQLAKLARNIKFKKLTTTTLTGKKSEIFKGITNAIANHHLAIVGVRWSKYSGHWLLAVGFQSTEIADNTQLTHLLCLDPAEENPRSSLWNAVVEAFDSHGRSVNKGKLTSNHWNAAGQFSKCHIDEAIILKISD